MDRAQGHDAKAAIQEIVVATGFWSLGDPPDNSAFRVEFDVWLSKHQVKKAKSAYLEFVATNTQSSFVEVNGRAYLLPLNTASSGYLAVLQNTSMVIPLGLLRSGHNLIAFEAGPLLGQPGNLYDDFLLRDVVLVLSYR